MMKNIKIREVTECSAETCEAIEILLDDLSGSKHKFGTKQLETLVKTENTHLYVAYSEQGILGMYTLAVCELPTGSRIWLEDVVVAHTVQNCGLGHRLVAHAIEQARLINPSATLMLTSRPSRMAANHIYSTTFQKKETNVYCLTLAKQLADSQK